MKQAKLFAEPAPLPAGFLYAPEFLPRAEEAALIEAIGLLPLQASRYRVFTAKRRTVSYGGSYDFTRRELLPAAPVPEFLHPLRARVAAWAGCSPEAFTHALVAEYAPGTQLGWHRDVPDFEVIAGVSLAGSCRMRLRPYPHEKGDRSGVLALVLEPRSAYVMRGVARWGFQHSIAPTTELRYSITFRTRRRSYDRAGSGLPAG